MTKEKKNKSHESTIGKIIYGFLLFLPLLSIGTRCLYAILNKNAYQSYSQKTNTIIERVQNNDVINEGTLLTVTYNGAELYDSPTRFYVLNNQTDLLKYLPNENIYIDSFTLVKSGNRTRLQIYDIQQTQYNVFNWQNTFNDFYFVTKNSFTSTTINNADYNLTYVTYINASIDDVFEYSINKVEQNDLFNWTKETETYNVINNTTTLLGIENTFIDMLLTYWLLISIIYLIYDIGLMAVHIAHNKIHELEESI